MKNLRKYDQPSSDNEWFDFVKQVDCDFAIRQAYPKTVLKEDIDKQSYYFIKEKVEGVFDVFNDIKWQTAENKKLLGGSKIPCLDKHTVLLFYKLNKEAYERFKNQKEATC